MSERNLPIVIDNGSDTIRAGFSEDQSPKSVFPNIIGKIKDRSIGITYTTDSMKQKDSIGSYAKSVKYYFNVYTINPIQQGIIQNFDQMTNIWHHIFRQKLRIDQSQHPCLLTESPINQPNLRQRTTQIMFETFKVPLFYLSKAQALAMAASGRSQGLVFDSGQSISHSVPVFELSSIPNAIKTGYFGGSDLDKYLKKTLNSGAFQYESQPRIESFTQVKEKYVQVPLDYQQSLKNWDDKLQSFLYELPFSIKLNIGVQRIKCGQILFNQTFSSGIGLQHYIHNSINSCDVDLRKSLYRNIVICGGNTMFPGFQQRLKKQIIKLAPSGTQVNIIAEKNRNHLAWIGGSRMASLLSLNNMWITKDEYHQYGPQIVHKKCF